MDKPTNLHQVRPVSELIDFIKGELDAGRVTALTVIGISQDEAVFRETWIAKSGTAAYRLIGALETEKFYLQQRFFGDR